MLVLGRRMAPSGSSEESLEVRSGCRGKGPWCWRVLHHLGMVCRPKEKVLVSRAAAALHQEGREQDQAVATVTMQGFS